MRRMGRGKGKVAPTPKKNPVLSKRDRFHSEVLKYIPEINEFFPRYTYLCTDHTPHTKGGSGVPVCRKLWPY